MWRKYLPPLGIEPELFAAQTEKLRALLVERNKLCNLTRLTEPEDFYFKHVVDSLVLADFFPEVQQKKFVIADFGCGAGFPSLVLALAYPQLELYPIDSTGKKVDFVRDAAAELGLTNIYPVWGRGRELSRKAEFRGKFDILTARAVSTADKIAAETAPMLKNSGRFLLYKTPIQRDEELPALALNRKFHWEATQVRVYPHGERLFFIGTRCRD